MIAAGVLLVLAYAFYGCLVNCLVDIPAFTGYLIRNVCTKKLRSVGPGLHFMIPKLEELVEPGISLRTNEHIFEAVFQTQGETAVKLTIKIEEAADPDGLPEYSSFEDGKRISGIKERIKEILDEWIRPTKDRDAVVDALEDIAGVTKIDFEKAQDDGKSLPKHFGTRLLSLGLFPAELPPAVVAAKAEEEAQAMKNKTKKMEADALRVIEEEAQASKDRTQKMQADNFRKMSNEIMESAKEHGQDLSYEKAYRMVQLEFGKGNLKEEINTYGIDQGSQELIEKLVKEVIERWLPRVK